jgi:hypothetical protein
MIREDVELFIWRGRRRGADVVCSLADLGSADNRELEAMSDREWAAKVASDILDFISRSGHNPRNVKHELLRVYLNDALAKRDAEGQLVELSAEDAEHIAGKLGAMLNRRDYTNTEKVVSGIIRQEANTLLREKRSGK